MAVFKFSKIQQSRLIELYHEVTIPSKGLSEVIEKEMGISLPYEQIKYIYNTFLNLPLRKRGRKEKVKIEFEEDILLEPNEVLETEQIEQDNW